ncbi:MAG: protein kinase [Pirellulales bacterium]
MTLQDRHSLSFDWSEECEYAILEFEKATREGPILKDRILACIASVPNEHRLAVLAEIACIDVELTFDPDSPLRLSSIFEYFPELWLDRDTRRSIASEHARLAAFFRCGLSPNSMASLYQIDAADIPEYQNASSLDATSDPNIHFPSTGTRIGDYPLLCELGRGALARVYLSRQSDLANRLVVLKVTSQKTAESEQLAKLQHTNIVPIYSVHRLGEFDCICMPFQGILTLGDVLSIRQPHRKGLPWQSQLSTLIERRMTTLVSHVNTVAAETSFEGETSTIPKNPTSSASHSIGSTNDLASLLGEGELRESLHHFFHQRDELRAMVELFAGIASGIAYAHENGIVHQDLKPENILIAHDFRPIVLDFNLATSDKDRDIRLIGGTLPYLSPECLRNLQRGERGTASDDVYALGTIFYRMLTGRLPSPNYDPHRSLEEYADLKEQHFAPMKQALVAFPPSLQSIVCKCLTSASERYPTAKELAEDLQQFLQYQTLKHAPDRSLREHGMRFLKRHPVLASNSVLGVIVSFAMGALLLATLWSWNQKVVSETLADSRLLPEQQSSILAMLRGPKDIISIQEEGMGLATDLFQRWGMPDAKWSDARLRHLPEKERRETEERLGFLAFDLANSIGDPSLIAATQGHSLGDPLAWNHLAVRLNPQLELAAHFQRTQLESSKQGISIPLKQDAASWDVNDHDGIETLLLARELGEIVRWRDLAETRASTHPLDPNAWSDWGSALYANQEFLKAHHAFDMAYKLQSKTKIYQLWRGITRIELQDFDGAIADFTSILKVYPDWDAARYNRALANQQNGSLPQALEDLDLLITKDRMLLRAHLLRSRIHLTRQETNLAQQDLKRARGIAPADAEEWTALAMTYLAEAPKECRKLLERALEFDPKCVSALQNLAYLESEIFADPPKAIQRLEQLRRIAPRHTASIASLGILQARNHQWQESESVAKDLASLHCGPIEKLQLAGIYSHLLTRDNLTSEQLQSLQDQGCYWLGHALRDQPELIAVAETDPDLLALRERPAAKRLLDACKVLSESLKKKEEKVAVQQD